MPQDIDAIVDDLAFLDDWEERYRYIIDLGKTLEPLSEAEHDERYKVRGCASQVWLVSALDRSGPAPRLMFRGDSDAHIVRGLVALTLALFSGKTAADILTIDAPAFFAKIGLKDHLTPQRSNGLAAMVERIRLDARQALA
jgi:cysteine desulfuration protein SufE